MSTDQNWSRTVENCSIYDRPYFLGPKIVQNWGKIWNLGPYHLLDIITKEKPAKFQTKRTAGSKVLRLCNFCAPKRVKTRKGPKSVPYVIFLSSRWRYPEIMGTDQIWSETGLNSPFRTDRTIGPKIVPPPKPLFSEGNWKFRRW